MLFITAVELHKRCGQSREHLHIPNITSCTRHLNIINALMRDQREKVLGPIGTTTYKRSTPRLTVMPRRVLPMSERLLLLQRKMMVSRAPMSWLMGRVHFEARAGRMVRLMSPMGGPGSAAIGATTGRIGMPV